MKRRSLRPICKVLFLGWRVVPPKCGASSLPLWRGVEQLGSINAIAELERAGWPWEPRGNDEILLKCPVHDDTHPSVNLNTKKNLWKCQASQCAAKGDIITLLSLIYECHRTTMVSKLSETYDLKVTKTLSPTAIEKWHSKIWDAGPLLQALYDRGVDAELVKKSRLGFHSGRITIPIYDTHRRIINVRKYLPGAPGPEKMRNTRGYKNLAIYMPEQLKYDTVWLCGGEIKALVASKYLNPINIGAFAVTGGEGAWDKDFTPRIKDKTVYICMDIDAGGVTASQKLASQLLLASKATFIINLPLDLKKYPKGDINDWISEGGVELGKLMEDARAFEFVDVDAEILESVEVRLNEATSSANMGKRINCDGLVCSMDTTPYFAPHIVNVSCSRDQSNCSVCPINTKDVGEHGSVEVEVKGISAGILEVIQSPKGRQREAVRESMGIPLCRVANFTIKSNYSVYDTRITPQLDLHYGGNSEHVIQPAYIVTQIKLQLNSPYALSGRLWPSPRSQQAILLMDRVDETPDNLDTYSMTGSEAKSLEVFQPKEWTVDGIQQKLDEIYADFESNVTRIFKRRNLHLAFDLAWHSCLYFKFDGRTQNGWINCLITGDSSQGKSEAALRLLEHYELGTRFDCKRATTPGLLGGVQQFQGRWFTTWGIIPMHDRQLVVMEEIKGMHTDVLSSLTDMRSSGIAEIVKIEKSRSHARTRLVMISNPRDNRPVSAHPYGIGMLKELVGTPEDIRRFDFAVILSATHIPIEEINRMQTDFPVSQHVYTKTLCKRCVLFAWTRTVDQIRFDDDAARQCIDSAIELCSMFSEVIPLVDRGTMRYKIARMSIALALRTFSSDGDLVQVRKCHVDYVTKYIKNEYTDDAFGYDNFTSQQDFHARLRDEPHIRKQILNTRHPNDLVNHLLVTDEIMHSDLQDWCEIEWDDAKKLMSMFIRKHAILRDQRVYKKTPAFIKMLKDMKTKGLPEEGEADAEDIF